MKLGEAQVMVLELLAEGHYISVSLLMEKLGISDTAACYVIKACWEESLLLPVDQAYFASPVDGHPAVFVFKSSSRKSQRPALIMEKIESRPDEGFILREVAPIILEVDKPSSSQLQKVREDLDGLVADGRLMRRSASTPGSYGNPPVIWGLTPQALENRDARYAVEKKKPGRKKKSSTPTRETPFVPMKRVVPIRDR